MARSGFANILVPLLAVAFMLLPLHHAWGATHDAHGGADAVHTASAAGDEGCGQTADGGQVGGCVFCASCVSAPSADSAEPTRPLPGLASPSIEQPPSRVPALEPRPPRLPLA